MKFSDAGQQQADARAWRHRGHGGLRLACAEAAGAKRMASLDEVLGRHAQRLKFKPVVLRGTP